MSLLAALVVGLIVGAIAKLLMPGRDPGGIIVTMLIGVAGALLATFLGRALNWYGPGQSAGWIASVIGAVVLLLLYRLFTGRRGTTVP